MIMETSKGRARQKLESIPPEEGTSLRSIVGSLEQEFYSAAKQTAAKLLFNERVRYHGETKCKLQLHLAS